MKLKIEMVTNSSSTAFLIHNKTNKILDLVDFVKENPHLIEEFLSCYDWYKKDPNYTQEKLLESAKQNNIKIYPGDNYMVFGDESGTVIGCVFDYILRDGGSSKSFSWEFEEYLR